MFVRCNLFSMQCFTYCNWCNSKVFVFEILHLRKYLYLYFVFELFKVFVFKYYSKYLTATWFWLGVDVQRLDVLHIVTARVSWASFVYVYVLQGRVCMTVVNTLIANKDVVLCLYCLEERIRTTFVVIFMGRRIIFILLESSKQTL